MFAHCVVGCGKRSRFDYIFIVCLVSNLHARGTLVCATVRVNPQTSVVVAPYSPSLMLPDVTNHNKNWRYFEHSLLHVDRHVNKVLP